MFPTLDVFSVNARMEALLTIDEAAGYLSVSKTSLRRWTRDGILECVRIGPRAERRFRRAALDGFLQRRVDPLTADFNAPSGPIDRIESAAASGVPRHVSLHHSGRTELWDLFRPYVLAHLGEGAPMLYIYEEGTQDDVLAQLDRDGLDVDALKAAGLLRLLEPSEAYLRTGQFVAVEMIDFMEQAILAFHDDGHDRLLISGAMTWCLTDAPGVDEMIAYEDMLNPLLQRYPAVTIVCHYDVDRLPGRITLGALCTHHHVQLPDRLSAGFARTLGAK